MIGLPLVRYARFEGLDAGQLAGGEVEHAELMLAQSVRPGAPRRSACRAARSAGNSGDRNVRLAVRTLVGLLQIGEARRIPVHDAHQQSGEMAGNTNSVTRRNIFFLLSLFVSGT